MPGQELPVVMYIVKLLRMLGNKILIILVLRCFLDCANKTVPGGSRENCMFSVIYQIRLCILFRRKQA